jgi:hypothetical protein
MRSEAKLVGAALAAGRIAIGAGIWLAPKRAARVLGFDRFDSRALILARILAGRDLVLGVWQARALDDPDSLRRVSTAAAVADAGDALAFTLAIGDGDELGAGLRGIAVALPAAIAGLWLARRAA